MTVLIRLETVIRGYCSECGAPLKSVDHSDKYQKPGQCMFVEPCQGCIDEKLRKLKELL